MAFKVRVFMTSFSCRPKREDDPMTVPVRPTELEIIVNGYQAHDKCRSRNIMVCKKCFAMIQSPDFFSERAGPFQAWCFDDGSFLNEVSPFLCPRLLALKWQPGQWIYKPIIAFVVPGPMQLRILCDVHPHNLS